ncbi:MAG TPA: DUF2946 family protein [Roseomonas sp.]|nr:DUF2946 family protein [Roseomonas sp.]
MRDLRRSLLRVLAVLLLVQWAAALQPCLRSLAGIASAQAIELCSPSGSYRTMLVDQDGKEVPRLKPHPGCPLCQHAGPVILPQPPVMQARVAAFLAVAQPSVHPGLPPAPPRGPPQQPRAPPFA